MRDGREARPFFDPKRGQLGANFSGGTGLTRPSGILVGAHTTVAEPRLVSPREPRATCIIVAEPLLSLPAPRRRLETPREQLISREPHFVFGEPRQSTVIEDHVENKKKGRRALHESMTFDRSDICVS